MGGGTTTPWNVLSGAIAKRVGEARQKRQAEEQRERDLEFATYQAAIQGELSKPNPNSEVIDQIFEKMRKNVPKDSIPIVEAYKKVAGVLHKRKQFKQQQQGGGGGGGQPGQGGEGQPQIPRKPQPQPAPTQAPSTIGQITTRAMPSPADIGTAAGQTAAAQDEVLAKSRRSNIDALRKSITDRGDKLSPEESFAFDVYAATGTWPSASMTRPPKRHPVSVIGSDGKSLVPGMEDESGQVWVNGAIVDNPKLMPKWKPHKGWTKLANGQFMSFNIDPTTNQPIPGTESSSELPPSAYLEHVREGVYHWTDDSGTVHESPFSVSSFARTPNNVTGRGGTPAVPPAFRELPKPTAPAEKGAAGTVTAAQPRLNPPETRGQRARVDRILGTKDTGVLSPVGQRAIINTEPVLKQARKLEAIFDANPDLKTNDQAGYLLIPYILYRLGYATEGPLNEEIAGLSLGSVIEAASALQGTSRAVSALNKAMIHTPNAKTDSPMQIYRKLHNDIIPRLDDIVEAANKYGRKRMTSTEGAATVPPGMTAPPAPPADDVNKQADKWLQEHP